MKKIFWIIVSVLTVATVVLAIVAAYVIGVEQGVNSQQWRIKELLEELHPGFIVDFFPWMHPLRNALFASTLFIGICWILFVVVWVCRRLRHE